MVMATLTAADRIILNADCSPSETAERERTVRLDGDVLLGMLCPEMDIDLSR